MFPPLHPQGWVMTPAKAEVLAAGRDVTICAMGSLTCEAVKAAGQGTGQASAPRW